MREVCKQFCAISLCRHEARNFSFLEYLNNSDTEDCDANFNEDEEEHVDLCEEKTPNTCNKGWRLTPRNVTKTFMGGVDRSDSIYENYDVMILQGSQQTGR